MLVQILASNQFTINILSTNIKCVVRQGYAEIFESNFSGEEYSLLWYIEDVNTITQAIEVLYEEYSSGRLYKKIMSVLNKDVL